MDQYVCVCVYVYVAPSICSKLTEDLGLAKGAGSVHFTFLCSYLCVYLCDLRHPSKWEGYLGCVFCCKQSLSSLAHFKIYTKIF